MWSFTMKQARRKPRIYFGPEPMRAHCFPSLVQLRLWFGGPAVAEQERDVRAVNDIGKLHQSTSAACRCNKTWQERRQEDYQVRLGVEQEETD